MLDRTRLDSTECDEAAYMHSRCAECDAYILALERETGPDNTGCDEAA